MTDTWDIVRAALAQEFSDITDLGEAVRIVVRLTVAGVLAGIIGYEREASGKPAGLRTHILVALGAALFVLVPAQSGMRIEDLSRVLQGIVAGIGFLVAGAIIKLSDERRIKGLTTSASIWMTAAIGVAAGMGREMTAILSTVFALFVLAVLRHVEVRVANRRTADDIDNEV